MGLPLDAGKVAIFDVATGELTFKEDAELPGSNAYITSVAIGSKAARPRTEISFFPS